MVRRGHQDGAGVDVDPDQPPSWCERPDDSPQHIMLGGFTTAADPAELLSVALRSDQKDAALAAFERVAGRPGSDPEWLRTGAGPVHRHEQGRTVLVPKVAARAFAGGGSLELGDAVIDLLSGRDAGASQLEGA